MSGLTQRNLWTWKATNSQLVKIIDGGDVDLDVLPENLCELPLLLPSFHLFRHWRRTPSSPHQNDIPSSRRCHVGKQWTSSALVLSSGKRLWARKSIRESYQSIYSSKAIAVFGAQEGNQLLHLGGRTIRVVFQLVKKKTGLKIYCMLFSCWKSQLLLF